MSALLEAPIAVEERVELLPLDLCRPSSYNPRAFPAKPSQRLVELAISIRRTGQVQPATVRPIASGYEIVAGERRWRACSLRADQLSGAAAAALETAGPAPTSLRAVVRELTDEQAMEVCGAVVTTRAHALEPVEAVLIRDHSGRPETVKPLCAGRGCEWLATHVASYVTERQGREPAHVEVPYCYVHARRFAARAGLKFPEARS